MKLFDVNVLIYAHFAAAPEHEAYARLLRETVEAPEPFALSELVLSGFIRVATAGRLFDRPSSATAALAFVDELVDQPNARLVRPGLEHWRIFRTLLSETNAAGKLVADAYHAALAIEQGCEWLSADADFGRFRGLRWRHPLRR